MPKFSALKRIAAAAAAVTFSFSALTGLSAGAEEGQKPLNIVILGDSISAGYGLKEDECVYAKYLGSCLGGNVTNLAVSGYTTHDVIRVIDDAANAGTLAEADLICISVGANDMVGAAKKVLASKQKPDESLIDTVKRLAAEGDPAQLMSDLTGAIREPRTQAKENYAVIESKLRALNPDAQILMETIYNPMEVPVSYLTERNIDTEKFKKLSDYVNNNEKILNKAMAALESVKVVDVSAAYAGAGWNYVRIFEKDVHPTPLGQAVIAALIMETAQLPAQPCYEMRNMLEQLPEDVRSALPAERIALLEKYAAASITKVAGDLNADGRLGIVDAVLMSRYLSEDDTLNLNPASFANADCDGDGLITLLDLRAVLSKITA